MSKIGRALKMENDEERRAREWEEARERQNHHDRQERNTRKAQQAADEARRKQLEEDETRRRRAAAEKIEREHRSRLAEAERLRQEERRRKDEILKKHEEERRRKAAEEQAKIERQIAEKRRAEEAEFARKRKVEEAARAKKRQEEEEERARLQAIEDEKRAVEEAKQKYFMAIAEAHASVEREDREHVGRSKHMAEARARWIQEKGGDQRYPSGSDEQPASDSGISFQSGSQSSQQGRNDLGQNRVASPDQSPSLHSGSHTQNPDSLATRPQLRSMTVDDSVPHSQSKQTMPFQLPDSIQRSASQGAKNQWGNASKGESEARTVHFHDSPEGNTMVLPRERLPASRFTTALTVGARSTPATNARKSALPFSPSVTAPWDAGLLASSESTPHLLANLAYQAALADTSDPTKPVQGEGWRSHGFGHSSKIPSHYTVIQVEGVRLTQRKIAQQADNSKSETDEMFKSLADETDDDDDAESVYEEVWEQYTNDVLHFDLFERVFTRTTPDVLERLVANLDCADVKALRQTCKEVRFALDHLEGREIVLRRFLEPVGYRTWKIASNGVGQAGKDPLPLTFGDIEAFMLSSDVYTEYCQVAMNWVRFPHEMDNRVPRLARSSTRAYSRLLSRLRAQPDFVYPKSATAISPPMATLRPLPSPASGGASPAMSQGSNGELEHGSHTARVRGASSHRQLSSSYNQSAAAAVIPPWKPGRAALFRVWVPTANSIWQSDEEVARCERELFLAGVWSFLQRGDIVWNVAMGDENNVGRMIFDGQYLRDLAYRFDKAGHLPSWQNLFLYSPGYYHNVVRSSTPNPIVFLDILPWREQIVSSLRLVQDQVETANASGGRYRIAKWLYRAVAHVKAGHIISDEGLVCADEGWEGRLVFETEGTSEHAKDFVARCAGPLATPQAKAQLLAVVLGGSAETASAPSGGKSPSANGLSILKHPAIKDPQGRKVAAQTPFAVLRERSRPGLIWLRPVTPRESLQ